MDNNSIFILIGLLIISLSFCNNNTNSQNNIFSSIYLILIVGIIFNLMKSEKFIKNSGKINSSDNERRNELDAIEYFQNAGNAGNAENGNNEISEEVNYNSDNNNNVNNNNNIHSSILPSSCNTISSAELLPSDPDQFSIENVNFINDGELRVGIISQTLRNANLNLRSEPPNPQVQVSPWLQTTIEPDLNRKPLEGCM